MRRCLFIFLASLFATGCQSARQLVSVDADASYEEIVTSWRALSEAELRQAWNDRKFRDEFVALGRRVHKAKRCSQCHNTNGSPGSIGPTHFGFWGSKRTFTDESSIPSAGEEYVRETLREPKKRVVRGYEPVMPSYAKRLTEPEILGLLALFESLSADNVKRTK